jgi:metal-sulfur cluster biosynthetic enzyme
MPLQEDQVRDAIKQVIDPELFVNIVDLGLIYVVDIVPIEDQEDKFNVNIEMTMTSPMCPAGPQLVAETQKYASDLEQVENVDVKVVMDPPWTQDMMSDDARDQLGIF